MRILNKLFFCSSMSLGDAFVFYPISRIVAKTTEKMYLPCLYEYRDTLLTLYADESNIELVSFDSPYHENEFVKLHNLTRIESPPAYPTMVHIDNPPRYVTSSVNWDRNVYEYFDILYSERYREFVLPKHIPGSKELYQQLTDDSTDYVLWNQQTGHHKTGMGIDLAAFRQASNLPDMKIIEVNIGTTNNMMHYIDLIKNAKEIHCVNTSFFWLVDSVFNLTDARLFYHDRRAGSMAQINSRWNNNRWTQVNYDYKI
jgi:hypothetical protein